jgi:hypothetical protein
MRGLERQLSEAPVARRSLATPVKKPVAKAAQPVAASADGGTLLSRATAWNKAGRQSLAMLQGPIAFSQESVRSALEAESPGLLVEAGAVMHGAYRSGADLAEGLVHLPGTIGGYLGRELATFVHESVGDTATAGFIREAYGFGKYLLTERTSYDLADGALTYMRGVKQDMQVKWALSSSVDVAHGGGYALGLIAQTLVGGELAQFARSEEFVGAMSALKNSKYNVDLQMPLYVDASAYQLNSGLPIGVRGVVAEGVANGNGVYGARGPISGREFEPENAGGPIRNLNTDRVKVTDRGIGVVQKHVSRFGQDDANDFMIARLEKISRGEIPAEQVDLNFYTHELREYVRYRKLGWESGVPQSSDDATRLWNNAHTATLEDYRLSERAIPHPLYHPDAP